MNSNCGSCNDQYLAVKIAGATDFIKSRTPIIPLIGIICGSGLSNLAASMIDPTIIDYSDIPGFAVSSVAGHSGKLAIGQLCGIPSAVLLGRFHYYEGYDLKSEVTIPVRVLANLGIRSLLLTNAAGAIDSTFKVGDFMNIDDHISFPAMAGINPLKGANEMGPRFVSLTKLYAPTGYEMITQAAKIAGIPLERIHNGIYINVSGPAYETPAELRFMRLIGGSVVGMSTTAEATVAAQCGIEQVIAFSMISNRCVLDRNALQYQEQPSHEEVLTAGKTHAEAARKLIDALVPIIANSLQ